MTTTIKKENIEIINYTARECASPSMECGCIIVSKKRLINNIDRGFTTTETGGLTFGCQNGKRVVSIKINNISDMPEEERLHIIKNHINSIEESIIEILEDKNQLGNEVNFLVLADREKDISYNKEKNILNLIFKRGFRKKTIENLLS